MLNSLTLVGRVGRDPEVKHFESGSVVAKFTLAVDRRSKGEEPDWFNIEIWGKAAEVAGNYVRKGGMVGITGSLQIERWQDKGTSADRSKPVVKADTLKLISSSRQKEEPVAAAST